MIGIINVQKSTSPEYSQIVFMHTKVAFVTTKSVFGISNAILHHRDLDLEQRQSFCKRIHYDLDGNANVNVSMDTRLFPYTQLNIPQYPLPGLGCCGSCLACDYPHLLGTELVPTSRDSWA